ncbi:hypothetical protein ACSBR1_000980 [Camellia fascicularis]
MFVWFNAVAVGNIPYDASEEQLIQICEEVGPVVSFRLVIDRETGKPKGYGFCEYKDEETALSARRNLQGYDINGRQLRVDFAENDKNADKNREQGRGGPGMVANVDPPKQFGGPAIVGNSGFYQPIGLQVAMAAASLMAGLLGGAQASRELNQNGLQGQPTIYSDPLTLHLAKMSRNQLNEVISELKVMATQNKEHAHQLLLSSPQFPKALFQAQIMLGMVTPQMLQMPNILQTSVPLAQPLSQDDAVPTLPGLPPFAQNKMQFGLMARVQEAQVSSLRSNSMAHNQYSDVLQLPTQPRVQVPQLVRNQMFEQGILPGHSGISTLPSIRPLALGGVSTRPPNLAAPSSYLKQQMQPTSLQHQGQAGAVNFGHNGQLIAPNTTFLSSLLIRPLLSDQKFQPGTSILPGIPDMINKDADRTAQGTNVSTWVHKGDTYSSLPSGSSEKANMVHDTSDPLRRPSKLVKLDDGRSVSLAMGVNMSTSLSGQSQISGAASFGNQTPKAEEAPPVQLPPEMESALLQQVLSLTPEQLSSLPPDQQRQVIQLQQMLLRLEFADLPLYSELQPTTFWPKP